MGASVDNESKPRVLKSAKGAKTPKSEKSMEEEKSKVDKAAKGEKAAKAGKSAKAGVEESKRPNGKGGGEGKAVKSSHKSKTPKAPKGNKGGSGSQSPCPVSVVLNDINANDKLSEYSSDKEVIKCFDTSQVTTMEYPFMKKIVN